MTFRAITDPIRPWCWSVVDQDGRVHCPGLDLYGALRVMEELAGKALDNELSN